MKFLPSLAAVCLLIVPSVLVAQQILPNPNPAENTITGGNPFLHNVLEFDNDGSIHINNNGTLNNGETLTNNGTFDNTDGTFVNNGFFVGDGTFLGQLDDAGVLAPGNSAGVLTLTGDLNKTAGSIDIELGGLFDGGGDKSLTEFDWLDVTGNVDLAGLLNVSLIDDFSLAGGMSFDFLRVGGTLSGQFDGFGEGDLVGNFGGQDLFITYTAGSGNIAMFTNVTQPGDHDGDGMVDGFDFLFWQRNPSVGPLADWENNYGMGAPLSASSATVPEPTTSALVLAALCLAMSRRRST